MAAALAARGRRGSWRQVVSASLWAGLGPWLAPSPAPAQDAHERARSEVVLVLASSPADQPAELRETLRELLSRLELTLVAPSEAHEARVAARLTITLDADEAHVSVLSSAAGAQGVERDVPRAEPESLYRETIGHVVLGLVEPIALTREPVQEAPVESAPVAVPEAAPPAQKRDQAALVLSLGAGAGVLRSTTSAPSAWLFSSLSLTSERALRPAGSLSFGGSPRMAIAEHGVEANLHLFSVRAHTQLSPWQGTRFALLAGIGAGINVLSMKSSDSTATVQYARDSLRVQGIISTLLGLTLRLSDALALLLRGGLEIDPQPRSWYVQRGADSLAFAETPSLLPYLTLALDVRVARTRRYESER